MPVVAIVLIFLFYAAVIAFAIYLYVRIARKAGYSGWWAALCFVPLGNIVVLIIFSFQEWPIERELRLLRAGAGGYPAPAGYPAATPYGYSAAPIPPWEQGPRPGVSTDPRFATPPAPPSGYGQDGPASPYDPQR